MDTEPANTQCPDFLSTEDFAQRTGKYVGTVRRWIKGGIIPAVQPAGPGSPYLISKDLLEEFRTTTRTNVPTKAGSPTIPPAKQTRRRYGPAPAWKRREGR
jgi:excisionase family DNA binding protein